MSDVVKTLPSGQVLELRLMQQAAEQQVEQQAQKPAKPAWHSIAEFVILTSPSAMSKAWAEFRYNSSFCMFNKKIKELCDKTPYNLFYFRIRFLRNLQKADAIYAELSIITEYSASKPFTPRGLFVNKSVYAKTALLAYVSHILRVQHNMCEQAVEKAQQVIENLCSAAGNV